MKRARHKRKNASQGVRSVEASSVDVTPQRPRKRLRIRRRRRKPDPTCCSQSSSCSSSLSHLTETGNKSNSAKRELRFSSAIEVPKPWSEEEVKALVSYLRFRGQRQTWTASKNTEFWESAAGFIANCTPGQMKRTGSACRNKVLNTLRKKFKSPEEAEAHYFPLKVLPCDPISPTAEVSITSTVQSIQPTPEQKLQVLSQTFTHHCSAHSNVDLPEDFLVLATSAMEHLQSCGRSNVVYTLAKVLGTMRKNDSDSLLPAKRMPMGLIEHCVNFFCSSSTREIQCPNDYRQWLVSMFSLFGTKFVKLYSGPMWRVETTSQDSERLSSSKLPVEARTNIPGLSERTLQRDIVASGVTMGAGIQTLLLESAVKANPNATWWIKGDGCDIVPGLCESVQQKWSGDVDLNTGELQRSYQMYQTELIFISEIGLGSRQCRSMILQDLKELHQHLVKDKDFAISELTTADADYHNKLHSSEKATKALFDIGWRVEELENLVDLYQTAITTISKVTEVVADPSVNLMDENIARRLSSIRESATRLVRDLSRHRRTAATHIFVLMISSEQRDIKPYALPVQCVPYRSLNHEQLRRLLSNLIKEMCSRGMNVAGFCSNGEFNAMRSQGYTRPLSIFKIRSNVRSKYAKMSRAKMLAMLSSEATVSGQRVASVQNPAVSQSLLIEIAAWRDLGTEWNDIISRLRPRTVPSGYVYTPWKAGARPEDETEVEMLRSILAQLEFSHIVKEYDESGIPFRSYLHVPEIHPDTNNVFLEREDEGHVLKRIAQCTRNGGPNNLQLERYVEALTDDEAGLTYPALVGSRKQSVEDAERLFSPSLLKFMEKKGYTYEAKYISAILGWRQACDVRGLSALERCRRNYVLLNFILEELMPWSKETYDFSLFEVNRDITKVCGFTREVLVAVVANIETREWRRREISQHSLKHENPRASNTDDVECFFSVMRDQVGTNFTLKQAQFAWRKVCLEFQKRIDCDLPFYYFTSAHDRFYEGARPSFDEPSKKVKKKRLPRAEQAVSVSSGRATLPVRGTLTIRPQFHKHPVSVPPPSTIPSHSSEHAYL